MRAAIASAAVSGFTLLAALTGLCQPGWAQTQTPSAGAASKPAISKAAPPGAMRPVASYRDIKYPPLKDIEIPKVETYTLPNGLRLYLLEDHTWPTINGRALIRAGNLFDPPDKIGLAEATGAVMRTGGTTSTPGNQLDQELESMAASVETGIGETSGEANFFTLKENFDKVLAIYADVLLHPAFRQDKLDLFKNQTRSAIARRNDDAGEIDRREFTDLVYGKDSPYGWEQEYVHVDAIQREDLLQFYRRYFFPANVMLAVYGDFSAAEMRAKLEAAFQGWNNPQPAVPPFPAVEKDFKGGLYAVDKSDVDQSSIRMGHLGGILKDPDFPALEVMSDILGGGGFRSRMLERVRTKLGYAYTVYADWGVALDHPGLFVAGAGTKSETTTQAIRAMIEEIERIQKTEVTDAELAGSKESVVNSFVFNFDTPEKTLNRLLTYEYYGYPKDFIFEYKKKLQAVTKQDVLRVAKQYLHPGEMTIVVVGKVQDFGEPLSALGKPVRILDITIPPAKPAAAETSQATPESLAKGKAALQLAQKAAGGADKLAALKDVRYLADSKLSGPMGVMPIKQEVEIIFPSILRQDNALPFGKMSVYSDGKSGWVKAPQGQSPLPALQLQQVRGELFRRTETLLLSDRDSTRKVNLLRTEKAGDREANVVEISSGGGSSVLLFIDAGSGELLKKQYQSEALAGQAPTVEESYGDYRDVDGVRVPFKISVSQNNKPFSEHQLTELHFNTGLKPEDLSRP